MGTLSETAHETGTASQQIVASVHQVSIGVEQIASAMTQIDTATVQSLDMAEQTKQGSKNLGEAAEDLSSNINAYKI